MLPLEPGAPSWPAAPCEQTNKDDRCRVLDSLQSLILIGIVIDRNNERDSNNDRDRDDY